MLTVAHRHRHHLYHHHHNNNHNHNHHHHRQLQQHKHRKDHTPRENSFDILVDTRAGVILETLELDADNFSIIDLPIWRKLWNVAKEKRIFYQERAYDSAKALRQLQFILETRKEGGRRLQLPESQGIGRNWGNGASEALSSGGFIPIRDYVQTTLVSAGDMIRWKNFGKRGKFDPPCMHIAASFVAS